MEKIEVETFIFRNGLSVKPFHQKGHPKTQPTKSKEGAFENLQEDPGRASSRALWPVVEPQKTKVVVV